MQAHKIRKEHPPAGAWGSAQGWPGGQGCVWPPAVALEAQGRAAHTHLLIRCSAPLLETKGFAHSIPGTRRVMYQLMTN